MSKKNLFISYKRGQQMHAAIDRFFNRLRVEASGFDLFLDHKSMDAGDAWKVEIDDFLARTTHFVAFVSIDYWLSEQCRRELNIAIRRYEKEGVPRLLFVLADPLNPGRLVLNEDEVDCKKNVLTSVEDVVGGKINNLAQINFLGPHDAYGRLVSLNYSDWPDLDRQLARMVNTIVVL